MLVSTRKVYRVQRWDADVKAWADGPVMCQSEAQILLHERHLAHPELTFRIICVTTTVEAGEPVGPTGFHS